MAATSSVYCGTVSRLYQRSPSFCCNPSDSTSLHFTANTLPKPLLSVPLEGVRIPFSSSTRRLLAFSATHTVLPVDSTQDLSYSKLEKPVIVIDNYDSFTYNLCQYLGSLGCPIEVYRNDELTVEELKMKEPSGILISPGPGTPQDSGISLETVIKLGPSVPLFGVCMGLQCMGEAFGGKVVRSPLGVVHGKKSLVYYDEHGEDGLLAGLPNPFVAGRYHSLVIDKENFPSNELEVTAWTEDGLVMGVRHKTYRHVQGVQFHPESIITENGMKIMENFLKILAQKAAHGRKEGGGVCG
eukprot:c36843_g1_i1 orf=509-1402(-)